MNVFFMSQKHYNRAGILSLAEGYSYIKLAYSPSVESAPSVIEVNGILVKFRNWRMKIYYHKGVKCATCDNVGDHFTLDKCLPSPGQIKDYYHVNLWTINGTLMTIDHIIPRSKGGSYNFVNLQPMCSPCNQKKDDKLC